MFVFFENLRIGRKQGYSFKMWWLEIQDHRTLGKWKALVVLRSEVSNDAVGGKKIK